MAGLGTIDLLVLGVIATLFVLDHFRSEGFQRLADQASRRADGRQ
jgi:hypothetical protein